MRHHNNIRTLGRPRSQRQALMRSLALALVKEGRIITTEAKAKEVRPFVEKLVTRAKTDTVANRRLLSARTGSDMVVSKLFAEIAPKYQDRAGGYTRILKLPRRGHDAAPMALIEFV